MSADRLSPCGCCGCPATQLYSYQQPKPVFGLADLLWDIIEPGLEFHPYLSGAVLNLNGSSLRLPDNHGRPMSSERSIVAWWGAPSGNGLALHPRPLPESSSGSTSVLRLYIGKLWHHTPAPNPFNPDPQPETEVRAFRLGDLPELDSSAEPLPATVDDEFVVGDVLFFADAEGNGLRLRLTYKVISVVSGVVNRVELKCQVFGASGGTHTFEHTVRPSFYDSADLISISIENRADDNVSIWVQEVGSGDFGGFLDYAARDYCVWADVIPPASRAGNRWGMMQATDVAYMTDVAIVGAEIRTASATAIADASIDSPYENVETYCDPCNLAAHPFFLPDEHRRRVKITVVNMPTIDYTDSGGGGRSYSFPTDLNGEYVFELDTVAHPDVPCGLNSILGQIGPWVEDNNGTIINHYWRPQPFHRFWKVGLVDTSDPVEWLDVVERQLFPLQVLPAPGGGTSVWGRGPVLWQSIATAGPLGYDAANQWWYTGWGTGGPVDNGAGVYQGISPLSYVAMKVEMMV